MISVEEQLSDLCSPQTQRGRARTGLAAIFHSAGLASAGIDARVLLCAACGIDHSDLIRDADLPLGEAADILASFAIQRLARVPVSRIFGRREFWGLSFAVSRDVLDPRPETEGVVGAVLDAIGGRRDLPLQILDLGTGSGAILCALLHELPLARGVGMDVSLAACRQAQANATALGLAARFAAVCGSWAAPLDARFDIVVSNPPYISRHDQAGLEPEVGQHDPFLALDGGADGLAAYRAFVPYLERLLRPGGAIALECGCDQGPAVLALLDETFASKRILKDLAGHDRVVSATLADVVAAA